ncbi:hypothetical protein ACJDT4_11945 [Clostridium neuense]|uniref:4Fe-4S ferredoxin-type domain-containing protein n=1 Tax=Clostridium neuense TaxID=1728934 RepID=A0ABW8TI51_9CLOT
MKYILKLEFKGKPECSRCVLNGAMGQDLYGNTVMVCHGLGSRPHCPEEGCLKDCPLKRKD